MTTTKTLLGSLAAAAVAALSIAAGTASAESPPTLTAAQGCSVQCVFEGRCHRDRDRREGRADDDRAREPEGHRERGAQSVVRTVT